MQKKALGRGLEVLIPVARPLTAVAYEEREQIVQVPVALIAANPYQPRRVFNQTTLQELADSFKTKGVIDRGRAPAESGEAGGPRENSRHCPGSKRLRIDGNGIDRKSSTAGSEPHRSRDSVSAPDEGVRPDAGGTFLARCEGAFLDRQCGALTLAPQGGSGLAGAGADLAGTCEGPAGTGQSGGADTIGTKGCKGVSVRQGP